MVGRHDGGAERASRVSDEGRSCLEERSAGRTVGGSTDGKERGVVVGGAESAKSESER
jgi:hypothetical protein